MNLNPFINTFSMVLTLYSWALIIYIILQWLGHFKIVNLRQPFMFKVYEVLSKLVEPALRRVRRFMPNLGGLDISPIAVVVIIYFIQQVMYTYLYTY